jgi:SWI/SNF-related matrix-associated actin-dependent regulator of chromatin subfamily A3
MTNSIVFSFWKTTLDIVTRMFDAKRLRYCRIHGQIPASKRSKILTEFEKSSDVRILLITLGTGAVGCVAYTRLNIACLHMYP